ncbi:hypothetical protein B484DRAFT_410142 [Ochromonadaceae sp. CCMP2298]|nr:hypothetical protein B484DRAFT_410142 [Ochromonadaceae sp. CCMP2298]
MKQVLLLLALGVARALTSTEASVVVGGANPAYVCSFCLVLFGLVEQAAYQVHLQSYLNEKCGAAEGCRKAVEYVVLQAEAGKVPEEICRQSSLCADSCSWGDGAPELYASWPVNPIPAQPQEWPVERRLSSSVAPDFAALQSVVAGVVAGVQGVQAHSGGINSIPSIGIVAAALGELHQHVTAKTTTDKTTPTVGSTDTYQPCDKLNVTCHLVNFGLGHLPLVDADQDRFPPLEARRLRGSDWRGADCDDQRADVYPGSRAEHGAEVDSNCNGIWYVQWCPHMVTA